MISAAIPVSDLTSANATLAEAGYGARNFSVPVYANGPSAAYAIMHAWGPTAFIDAVKALPNVIWSEAAGVSTDRVNDVLSGVNGKWSGNAISLSGVVSPGLHVDSDGVLWWVIQQYDTAIWSNPVDVPALVRRARVPGDVAPWVQPIDQFDAYKLVNPFTGQPDQVTHNGQTWVVTQADGAGNNVWEPGVFGWTVI
jgi:hypothetical protein